MELKTFYFANQVLGSYYAASNEYRVDSEGVEFTMLYEHLNVYGNPTGEKSEVKVFVPWSNITCWVKEIHTITN